MATAQRFAEPAVKTFSLDELRASAAEALGAEPGYLIKMPGGEPPVHIPHPLFVDEDRQEAIEEIQADDKSNNIALAKAVLGDIEHKRYIAAGGRSNDIALAWAKMQKAMTDRLPGSGTPTQPSTS